jgi:hypothetical protein
MDLTNCILSIVQVNNTFSYATLYMDNRNLFEQKEIIIQLSKHIFSDYSDKYKIDTILIFDKNHEYTISKKATENTSYILDTVSKANPIRISFR